MKKQTYVYVVVNYDYETYDEAMDDFDYSDCENVSSPSRVFTTPEVALKCALDFAKEEAGTYGRPYKISTIENQCEPECNAVLVHLTDDDSASVWAVRRMELQESYEPHMDEDMPLEKFDVMNLDKNVVILSGSRLPNLNRLPGMIDGMAVYLDGKIVGTVCRVDLDKFNRQNQAVYFAPVVELWTSRLQCAWDNDRLSVTFRFGSPIGVHLYSDSEESLGLK